MRYAVLGTGMVGQAISSRLAGLGHEVVMGSRDATNPKALAWAAEQDPAVRVATFADAAADAPVVVNATGGAVSLDVLRAAGRQQLRAQHVEADRAAGGVDDDGGVRCRVGERRHPDSRVLLGGPGERLGVGGVAAARETTSVAKAPGRDRLADHAASRELRSTLLLTARGHVDPVEQQDVANRDGVRDSAGRPHRLGDLTVGQRDLLVRGAAPERQEQGNGQGWLLQRDDVGDGRRPPRPPTAASAASPQLDKASAREPALRPGRLAPSRRRSPPS